MSATDTWLLIVIVVLIGAAVVLAVAETAITRMTRSRASALADADPKRGRRVQRIVDVGDDARYGERRVLLDGVTPAWGVWEQNAAGERQFEIHRTQQYPGLDTPREGPLPGDYRLRLASEEAPSGTGGSQTGLIVAAVACAVLSLGAVGAAGLLGRRRGV